MPADDLSHRTADAGIDAILANLKTLFTTSGICFVFVAGRGTHDRWLEDLGLGAARPQSERLAILHECFSRRRDALLEPFALTTGVLGRAIRRGSSGPM